jgi:N-acyl-L-homoserine lactone synthetase
MAMLVEVHAHNRVQERVALRAMFEARKTVFVDLLKWEIAVLDGRFEVDRFDDEHAIYIILTDDDHRHRASARLLPTARPGILASLFPHLAEGMPPAGEDIFEITRFCLSPGIGSRARRLYRDALVIAIARYARDHGIRTYTGVAELRWARQILDFGWDCTLLGAPRRHGCSDLVAFRIDIDSDTLDRLGRAGIVHDPDAVALPQAA